MMSEFCAKEFVDNLLKEGAKTTCDKTNVKFTQQFDIPDFYREETFQRGQKFFHKYKFALFFGKIFGLVSILAVPTILRILQFTNMSSEVLTSYRRYLSTIFHMVLWYKGDFKPGSQLWQSLQEVRMKHNSASKRSSCAGFNSITQMDMALTQFGFMGYALSRPKEIGLHDASEEDLNAFVHLWAVIGHLMGIEKQYNICRESLEETKAICNELIVRVFKPQAEKQNEDFVYMSSTLIDSMTCMQPFLEPQVCNLLLLKLVDASPQLKQSKNEQLTRLQKSLMWFVEFVMRTYRFTILRYYHNLILEMSFWLMRNFPFLAIRRFGWSNSKVTILNSNRSLVSVRNEQSG